MVDKDNILPTDNGSVKVDSGSFNGNTNMVLPKWNVVAANGRDDERLPTNAPINASIPNAQHLSSKKKGLGSGENMFRVGKVPPIISDSSVWRKDNSNNLTADDQPWQIAEFTKSVDSSPITTAASMCKMTWDDSCASLGPLRSQPIPLDWKIVGSPTATHGRKDSLLLLPQVDPKLAIGKPRRSRATSIGEFSPFNFSLEDIIADTSGSSNDESTNDIVHASSANESSTTQTTRLPAVLNEEIGVESAEEAAEVFRNSMEHFKASSFTNVPARGVSFDYSKLSSFDTLTQQPKPQNTGSKPSIDRRHSAWQIPTTEWIQDDSFEAEDYLFSAESTPRLGSNRPRHPRRHSIADTALFSAFGGMEDGMAGLDLADANELNMPEYGMHSPSYADYMTGVDYHEHTSEPPSAANVREAAFQLASFRGPLWAVEFKAGRTEVFFVSEADGLAAIQLAPGNLVIVEADRGEDLGRITTEISVEKLKHLVTLPQSGVQSDEAIAALLSEIPGLAQLAHGSRDLVPKRLYRIATPSDLHQLQAKAQEEAIAMLRCQSRIRQKRLPMEVVDAEYQWDRNKLTFYFSADRRIDFRELVRDLFRIYKTRIWMCAVDKSRHRIAGPPI